MKPDDQGQECHRLLLLIENMSEDTRVFAALAQGAVFTQKHGSWKARTPCAYITGAYSERHKAAYWALRAMARNA